MVIFNFVLSMTPFFYLAYFYFYVKKKYDKGITFDISHGMKCYSCKSDIKTFDEIIEESLRKNKKMEDIKGEKLCTSCTRDEKLNLISGNLLSTIRYKYEKFLVTKYNKFIFIFMFLIMTFLILDIFLKMDGFRLFFYLGQLIQLFYWYSFVKRWKLTSIKKPNQI